MENLQSLEAEYEDQQEELDATIASKQDEISNLDGMIQEGRPRRLRLRKNARRG